ARSRRAPLLRGLDRVTAVPCLRAEAELLELAIERGEAEAEPAGGLALVVAALLEDALDVPALVLAQRGAEVVGGGVGAVSGLDQAGGEVFGAEDRALAEDDRTLQGIVELADVPLPGGVHQAVDRGVVDAVDGLTQPPC